MKDLDKKEHFAKFGFEVPDFECELFFQDGGGWIFGLVSSDLTNLNHKFTVCWDDEGTAIYVADDELQPIFDLTPLKKEWYEEEDAFPCLLWIEDKQRFQLSHNLGNYKSVCELYACRLATNEEIDSFKKDIK